MTIPPERITVKRRRDEEPVDALYIRPEKSRKTIVWNRVLADDSQHESNYQISRPTGAQSQIPIVRTSLPEEDDALPPSIRPARLQQNVGDLAGSPHPNRQSADDSVNTLPDRQGRFPTRIAKGHRKFHLTRTSSAIRTSSALPGGIRKIRKKQNTKLAVFVERTDVAKELNHPRTNDVTFHKEQSKPGGTTPPPLGECSTPRKRPLASPAERNWRTQTWKQPLKSDAEMKAAAVETHEPDTAKNSDELALQLQEFALNVSGTGHRPSQVTRRPRAKVKPKPPKPRPAIDGLRTTGQDRKVSGDSTDHLSGFSGDTENFVFDVYVRQPGLIGENTSTGLQHLALEKADPDKIGVLVIEDEDQEIWDLYADEDQSSDEDWNSEEEDENAEGYYGNDYPEDELDSDDEYNRDTYKHWHSTFDEEDFEDDVN
ncbi:MAG: hypothetical protein Q9196_000014 [Gyalolechia fulgens]